jgi:hypothetical protein
MEYIATKEECARVLSAFELIKIKGRQEIYTIDLKHKLLSGTDLESLFAIGRRSLLVHVESGFKTVPTRVELRTDFKEADVNNLTEVDVELLLLPIEEM